MRRGVAVAERHGAGSYGLPAAFRFGDQTAAFPRPPRTRFAAGVRQLDARRRALAAQKARDARQKLDVFGLPDAHVGRRDTPARFHRGGLHANQPGATRGAAAEVNQVPVVGKPVFGGVLTHGRNRDPVAQCDLADGERR